MEFEVDDRPKSIRDNDMTPKYNYEMSVIGPIICPSRLILYGPTGIGKTTLGKFCLDHNCIIVNDLKTDLDMFDYTYHQGILFENIDFSYMGPFYILTLLYNPERMIQYGYCNVEIPADTRMVFTTSIAGGRIFHNSLTQAYKICELANIDSIPYCDDSDEELEDAVDIMIMREPPPRRVVSDRKPVPKPVYPTVKPKIRSSTKLMKSTRRR